MGMGFVSARAKTLFFLEQRRQEQERQLLEKIKKNEGKQIDRPMSVHNGGRGNNHSHRKIPPTDDT